MLTWYAIFTVFIGGQLHDLKMPALTLDQCKKDLDYQFQLHVDSGIPTEHMTGFCLAEKAKTLDFKGGVDAGPVPLN